MNLILALGGLLAAHVCVQLFLRRVWFKRQMGAIPVKVRSNPRAVVFPVDGTIVYAMESRGIELVTHKLGKRETAYSFPIRAPYEGWLQVGIYMSVFDRHSIIAPVTGVVSQLAHKKTDRNLPMLDLAERIRFQYLGKLENWLEKKAFGFIAENEKLVFRVGNVVLVAIADKYVNKIDLFSFNRQVGMGEVVAHIRRGSQVDIFVPLALLKSREKFKVGQRVTAGDLLCLLKS